MTKDQILEQSAKELSKSLHTSVGVNDIKNLYNAGNSVEDVIAKYFAEIHQVFG